MTFRARIHRTDSQTKYCRTIRNTSGLFEKLVFERERAKKSPNGPLLAGNPEIYLERKSFRTIFEKPAYSFLLLFLFVLFSYFCINNVVYNA